MSLVIGYSRRTEVICIGDHITIEIFIAEVSESILVEIGLCLFKDERAEVVDIVKPIVIIIVITGITLQITICVKLVNVADEGAIL